MVLGMSGLEWLVLVLIVVLVSLVSGLVLGKIARSMGCDDRDTDQPAGLWSGHERRKCRPYE